MGRGLEGRRMVLTGASSGIGHALASALVAEGSHVILAARSREKLDELARTIAKPGVQVIAVPTDVTIADDRKRLIETAVEKLGGIDVLINNAGIASWGHFADSTERIMREIMEVDFFAPVELIRTALPHLTKGIEPAIVNVSSMCGRRGMPAWPEYSAAKFALSGISEALRGEMARFDIDVILIVPGLTKTNLREHMLRNEGRAKIDFESGMEASDVAARIVTAIRRKQREVVIGSDARKMLSMHRWFPRWLDRIICRRVKKLYEEPK